MEQTFFVSDVTCDGRGFDFDYQHALSLAFDLAALSRVDAIDWNARVQKLGLSGLGLEIAI